MNEADYMPQIRDVWATRTAQLGLKKGTRARQAQLEAYLQGVLAALTVTGHMDMVRARQITFLVMVGRGEDFLSKEEAMQ